MQTITHIVLIWLQANHKLAAGDLSRIKQMLQQIPGVQNLKVATPIASERAIVDSSFDLALSMEFATMATMQTYQIHPKHVEFGELYIKNKTTKIVVYDF